MRSFNRLVASFMAVCMTSVVLPGHALASIVSTEEAAGVDASAQRDKIVSFLSRDDVRKSLEEHGVSQQAAIDRVKTLSDAEVQQLASDIEHAPAAGSDILGIALGVFILLLLTDILGLTKIFPFTRSVR